MCCEKALKSALALAAMCSGHTTQVLETAYRKYCADGVPAGFDDLLEVEEERFEQEEERGLDEEDGNECFKLLSTLQRETMFVDPDMDPADVSAVPPKTDDMAFEKASDKANFDQIFKDKEDENPVKSKVRLPKTLLEAMTMQGQRWNCLWRLIVRLRSCRGGIDYRWIKNAHRVRICSAGLDWHQFLGLRRLCKVSDWHFVAKKCANHSVISNSCFIGWWLRLTVSMYRWSFPIL